MNRDHFVNIVCMRKTQNEKLKFFSKRTQSQNPLNTAENAQDFVLFNMSRMLANPVIITNKV